MAAAYIRLATKCGLLLIITGLVWTILFMSARYTYSLMDRSVHNRLQRANDSTRQKRPWRLLSTGNNGFFHLNGKPKRIISGEFHYFRIHPAQWEDRLRRMRTAGLNTITTRVPWNFHQRQKSTIRFDGTWNLSDFIHIVHRLGFLLIVHVGPYIGSDWELGGLPSWLLHDRQMVLRSSSYPPFLKYVARYFSHLLPILERSTYRRHGPIIAVQIENELASYAHHDTADYITQLLQLVRSHGIQEPILTADRGPRLRQGSVPGALSTVTCHSSVDDVTAALFDLVSFQPGQPRLLTLLDHHGATGWGEMSTLANNTSAVSVDNFRRSVDLVLSWNASINIYGFSGGTNFGMWNGAVEQAAVQMDVPRPRRRHDKQRHLEVIGQSIGPTLMNSDPQTTGLTYVPVTTAYNYHRPPIISQSGHTQFSMKFHAFRRLLLNRHLISRLQTVPADPATTTIGVIRMDHQLDWRNILQLVQPIRLDSPVYMELLDSGQSQGWIVYRTRLPPGGSNLNVSGTMRDRAQMFINERHVWTVYNSKLSPFRALLNISNSTQGESTLEMVVENMGRSSMGLLDHQSKGFQGSVSLDGKKLKTDWEHFSIDFSTAFLKAIRQSRNWIPIVRPWVSSQGQPTMYRGHFKVKSLRDTHIDMSKWTKGVVVVNGFVLGRYWSIGPQQSLYVPSPILKHGLNELIVFELERTLNAKVKFVGTSFWSSHRHRLATGS